MAPNEPTPLPSSSSLYKMLFATAVEFVRSQDQDLKHPSRMDRDRVRAIRTTDFTHHFGHNTFVSTKPSFQGSKNVDQFLAHLGIMVPKLDTWITHITDIAVDEAKMMCVVRASYFMKPFGADQAIENDLIWWLWMAEEGAKVRKGMEFIDPTATARIMELMMASK